MRRYLLLLLGGGILGCWLIYSLVPEPRYPELWSAVDFFHLLIEPFPPLATMCPDTATDEPVPDQANYQLEVRHVSVPYGTSPHGIPPLSGYLNDISFYQFMEGVQGDVRCSTYMFPVCTISNAKPAKISVGSMTIQVKKTNEHMVLYYTHPCGTTFTQEFDLPEGIIFATNLGEHPALPIQIRIGPLFPAYLSFMNPLFTRTAMLRREEFLLLSYSEIEAVK
ncbi:MAG TPA: hypothetical protein PLN21_08130 [Gemmatales bacterium]|nr:hypothetical protein [Gemmatales bacterium]